MITFLFYFTWPPAVVRHRVREELVGQHLPGVDHHRQASHEHEAELVVTNVEKTVGIIFFSC